MIVTNRGGIHGVKQGPKARKLRRYKVFLKGELISHREYTMSLTNEEVRQDLINYYGFDPHIKVRRTV